MDARARRPRAGRACLTEDTFAVIHFLGCNRMTSQRPNPAAPWSRPQIWKLRYLWFASLPLAIAGLAVAHFVPASPRFLPLLVLLTALAVAAELLVPILITRRIGWRWLWEQRWEIAAFVGLAIYQQRRAFRPPVAAGGLAAACWFIFTSGLDGAMLGFLFSDPRWRQRAQGQPAGDTQAQSQ